MNPLEMLRLALAAAEIVIRVVEFAGEIDRARRGAP